ncbi:MAG: DUF2147 domain-containing protein [Pseudomonadota bacterium]
MHTPTRPFQIPLLRHLAALCLTMVALQANAQNASATADPRGRWLTANGNLEVEVTPCGVALCGTVTQVHGNRSMGRDGATMQPVDTRPALGMTLIKDFVPVETDKDGKPTQWSGDIYNRENGKTYRCKMSINTTTNGSSELVLHAYVGIPLFGKTQRWQRVAASAPANNPSTQH